ncbi:MAG TPA: hypothetical protein DEQ04_06605 [Thermovirga lienii]|jgi:hypothetical protein|nr:hypothetical protein [Thermovirga lienii]
MLKRISKGEHIGTINPLVDIYNSISLRYALPCGGEDIDKFNDLSKNSNITSVVVFTSSIFTYSSGP